MTNLKFLFFKFFDFMAGQILIIISFFLVLTKTPNMNNFSDKGMLFINTHCLAAICSPFRQIKFYVQLNK